MAQEFLHNLKFRSDAPKKRRIRMPERMPSDALLDAEFLGGWSYVLAQDYLSPVWPSSAVKPAGEDPVVVFLVATMLSPSH
jgi:hypothetical protein